MELAGGTRRKLRSGALVLVVVLLCSACASTTRNEVTSFTNAALVDGVVEVTYFGGACTDDIEDDLRFEDGVLFVQLYELTSGECVLDSPEKNYTIDLPSSFDPADVRSVMVPRCVNEDCSETEFVEAP